MQRNVSIDDVTGEKYGVCDIDGFFKYLSKIISTYWPEWSGEFHRIFPSVSDADSLSSEFIVAHVMSKEPMKVDTEFGRSGVPTTKTPTKGLVAPMLMKTVDDKSHVDKIEVWTQKYDVIIKFDIYAKANSELISLANKFEKLLREAKNIFMKSGLNNLQFVRYGESSDVSIKYKETYRHCYYEYFIQYEDVWIIRQPKIQAISINANVQPNIDIPSSLQLPLEETMDYEYKTSVSNSYAELSTRIPKLT